MSIKRPSVRRRLLAILLVTLLAVSMMPTPIGAESTSQWRKWDTWPCEVKVTGTRYLRFHTTPELGENNYARLNPSRDTILKAEGREGNFIVVYSEKDQQNVYGWAAYLTPIGPVPAPAPAQQTIVTHWPNQFEWWHMFCFCGCWVPGCMCMPMYPCGHFGCSYWFPPLLPCACGCMVPGCICVAGDPCTHYGGCAYSPPNPQPAP